MVTIVSERSRSAGRCGDGAARHGDRAPIREPYPPSAAIGARIQRARFAEIDQHMHKARATDQVAGAVGDIALRDSVESQCAAVGQRDLVARYPETVEAEAGPDSSNLAFCRTPASAIVRIPVDMESPERLDRGENRTGASGQGH